MLLESLDSIVWIKELLQEQQRKTCSSNALFEKPKSGNIATPVLHCTSPKNRRYSLKLWFGSPFIFGLH
jgi:hypothetical protein